jgi:hypothetical protein
MRSIPAEWLDTSLHSLKIPPIWLNRVPHKKRETLQLIRLLTKNNPAGAYIYTYTSFCNTCIGKDDHNNRVGTYGTDTLQNHREVGNNHHTCYHHSHPNGPFKHLLISYYYILC